MRVNIVSEKRFHKKEVLYDEICQNFTVREPKLCETVFKEPKKTRRIGWLAFVIGLGIFITTIALAFSSGGNIPTAVYWLLLFSILWIICGWKLAHKKARKTDISMIAGEMSYGNGQNPEKFLIRVNPKSAISISITGFEKES